MTTSIVFLHLLLCLSFLSYCFQQDSEDTGKREDDEPDAAAQDSDVFTQKSLASSPEVPQLPFYILFALGNAMYRLLRFRKGLAYLDVETSIKKLVLPRVHKFHSGSKSIVSYPTLQTR